MLAAYQLDLQAQIEAQLRGVHHMIRRLERLRSPEHRVGAEPSNGERGDALAGLSDEVAGLDRQLTTQRQSVEEMLALVTQMQERVSQLGRTAQHLVRRRNASAEDGGATSAE
jgi:uncharacterized coiled-coil protein SlyX